MYTIFKRHKNGKAKYWAKGWYGTGFWKTTAGVCYVADHSPHPAGIKITVVGWYGVSDEETKPYYTIFRDAQGQSAWAVGNYLGGVWVSGGKYYRASGSSYRQPAGQEIAIDRWYGQNFPGAKRYTIFSKPGSKDLFWAEGVYWGGAWETSAGQLQFFYLSHEPKGERATVAKYLGLSPAFPTADYTVFCRCETDEGPFCAPGHFGGVWHTTQGLCVATGWANSPTGETIDLISFHDWGVE